MSLDDDNADYKDWIFTFNLSKPIEYLGTIIDAPNIKLNTNKNNQITGFTITRKDSFYEEAEEKSNNKAKNLANIITIRSGMPIEANLRSYHSIPKRNQLSKVVKTSRHIFSIDGAIQNLDLNDTLIEKIVNSKPPHSEYYRHLSKSIFHYYNNNPIDCIKEGYLIIENNSNFTSSSKSQNEYTALRNVLSHPRTPGSQYSQGTFDLFTKTFTHSDFDYTEDSVNRKITIDVESNKNHEKLVSIAKKLIEELKSHLHL